MLLTITLQKSKWILAETLFVVMLHHLFEFQSTFYYFPCPNPCFLSNYYSVAMMISSVLTATAATESEAMTVTVTTFHLHSIPIQLYLFRVLSHQTDPISHLKLIILKIYQKL